MSNKFYLSKTNDTNQASQSERAIILNGSQVKFYRNNDNVKNLNGSYAEPTKSQFINLGTGFTKFFSGNNPGADNANTNAFAYMKANTSKFTDVDGTTWPDQIMQ